MKILITHSYFIHFDSKQLKLQQPYPPLATLYAVAVLRNLGCECIFFDNFFEKSTNKIKEIIKKTQPDIFIIYEDGFNYLTKMCLTNMREAALDMIQFANRNNSKVIISGSDATDHSQDYLQNGADFIIVGEGEVTLSDLVKELVSGNTGFEKIPGLVFKTKKNELVKTEPRNVLKDLDSIPLPAWDVLPIENYQKAWRKKWGYFSLNMTTTRGCPFKCNWCAKPIYGNRYNSRSPVHVVHELKFLKEKFNFDHVWFCDDIFGLKPGWISEFAEQVKKENLKFKFKIQCRVDLLLEEKNIELLAKAGCETVWVGAESGSQKILDAMDKGTTVEQIYKATGLLKKHHIRPAFFLQFGYPGETKEDIDLTFKMVNDLLPDDIGVSVSYPLPGTKFYDRVKEQLKEKSNWTDSDELALMFKNTYPASFYKELHRYIHKSYRTKQGMIELKNLLVNPVKVSLFSLKRIAAVPFHLSGKYFHRYRMKKAEYISLQ